MPERTFRLSTKDHDDRPVFIAGSFNGWREADDQYQMRAGAEPGSFELTVSFPLTVDHIEYKYTRGGWDCVELGASGESIDNRVRNPQEVWHDRDHVSRWGGDGLHFRQDLLPVIEVINEEFEIPQLIRTRRVAALLPHDYHQTDKRYPVLYLQDGQNLFDDYAPYGSWGVDKQLASLAERGMGDVIIVAIDHAAEQRISEFNPSPNSKLGMGEGRKYLRFLVETLKPYVDHHFRTKPEPEFTGIGGSSLGGLISIYAGIFYPKAYQRLMIFSPSLWVTPNIPFHLMRLVQQFEGRIYLYGGEAESKTMVSNMMRFRNQFLAQSGTEKVQFRTEIDPQGQHNEARWGQEFPKALAWLFFDQ
jgi:predicted alpha/beta superfamily hydrolase